MQNNKNIKNSSNTRSPARHALTAARRPCGPPAELQNVRLVLRASRLMCLYCLYICKVRNVDKISFHKTNAFNSDMLHCVTV